MADLKLTEWVLTAWHPGETCASISSPVPSGHREESRGVREDQHAKENNLIIGAPELEEQRAGPVGFFRLN